MQIIPDQHKKKAAWVAICVGLCAGSEGLRQVAYRDVGGIPTICYGETRNVHMGQKETPETCKEWLGDRVEEFGAEVDACTKVELPPARKAAFVDFAYNEGSTMYCRYIAPEVNAGKTKQACDHLMHFTKAGGIEFPGLVTRREKERNLCLLGLT